MYDLIIIGAGPTGIAVAIEAHQKGLSYIILEKGKLVNGGSVRLCFVEAETGKRIMTPAYLIEALKSNFNKI